MACLVESERGSEAEAEGEKNWMNENNRIAGRRGSFSYANEALMCVSDAFGGSRPPSGD